MIPHTPNMTIAEMREAMHTYTASSEASTATYKLAMDALFADQDRQASELITAACNTNASQHKYITQREAEHKDLIDAHEQRYALLEAELTAAKFNGFMLAQRSQTPAAATAPATDIFANDETSVVLLSSIQAFMQDDHSRAASPLPMFQGAQSAYGTNN